MALFQCPHSNTSVARASVGVRHIQSRKARIQYEKNLPETLISSLRPATTMGCFQQANSAGTTLHGSSVIQTSVSHQRLPTTANGYPVAFQLGCTYTYTQFVLEAFPPPYLPLSLPLFTHTLFYHFGRLLPSYRKAIITKAAMPAVPFVGATFLVNGRGGGSCPST